MSSTTNKSNFQQLPGRAGNIAAGSTAPDANRARLLISKLPKWQRERARRFHRICKGLEFRTQRGETLRKAIVRPVWYWKSRVYKSDASRSAAFSRGTIVRIYHQWRKGGKIPAAVFARYWGNGLKISPEVLRRFVQTAVAGNAKSFRQAHEGMPPPVATVGAFRHALPAPARKKIVRLFSLRRATLRVGKQLAQAFSS